MNNKVIPPCGRLLMLLSRCPGQLGLLNAVAVNVAAMAGRFAGLIAMMAVLLLSSASAQIVAFTNDPVATTYGGASDNPPGLNIGVTFNVSGAGIEVFQLGAFDWQGDGLNASHVVTLFHDETALASVTVPSGTTAPLMGGFRFAPLSSPIYLPAGTYAVVSYQMNGNNAGNDPYGENNASGFNGGGNASPADGIYQFTTTGSPLYPNNVAGGYDFQSASFTYTNVVGGAAATWTGGGANNNWSTSGNWNVPLVSPAALTFAGNLGLSDTNDIVGFDAMGITFDAAAGAFVLNGNSATLSGGINFNGNPSSSITQTINLPLTPSEDITIDTPANGNVAINGGVTSGNWLTKVDSGTLTLGGTNTFAALSLSGGTNVITGNVAFTGPSIINANRFYLADGDFINGCRGTLVIQPGATVSVTGQYGDAGVIGRDSGSGVIIQNGGVFSFNMANQSYLFVGASGGTATRSEYDMNGGVFNMNGETLGIALGANAVITGVVNQASGVITNVGNLYFDPFFTQGYGIYNLTGGSIYIGAGGITVYAGGSYQINLGGGTVAAEASWSSPLNMTLTGSNGPVTFNPAGNTITLSGLLSGAGGLVVSGGGVLELSGANTYTGGATVNAGSTLQLDNTGSSSGALRIANGGTVNLNFSGTFAVGSLYTNGVALATGTYTSGNLPGFISGSGTLQVASGISTGKWTGLGADGSWGTPANWDNNAVPIFPVSVTFGGTQGLNNSNTLAGITVTGITFSNTAGAFDIVGYSINLSGNIGFTANPATQVTETVNVPMNWTGAETIDTPTNGDLTLSGDITSSSDTSLIKLDTGVLALDGTNTIQSWDLNGGTTIIGGTTTLNGGGSSRMYIGDGDALSGCSGTLIIQPGADLTMSGSFADAFVIGRDGGSGVLIQNGGTFTYSANQGYLFVGATSLAGTAAQYDMFGGVLDMGGNTLGVALGDGGVVYTATLNQTGGSINNVFKLDLGAVRASGHGVFNLTGGSITVDLGGIVSDDNSYALNLGGGTIAASSSWASSLNMTLTGSNGPVTFDPAGNTITLSGVLSGPGGLIVSGGGILELSGANTYVGDTTVASGSILQLDSTGSSSGTFRVVDGGLFNLNFSGNYVISGLYTNGVAVANGTYNSANLPAFITGSGNLQIVGNISTGLWTGLGADNNWGTAANWDNNAVPIFPHALTFAGNTRLNNNNNLTGITVTGITFSNNAGAFILGGNGISLGGSIGFSANPVAAVTQTINFPMTWTGSETIDTPSNGDLTLGGPISSSVDTSLVKLDAGSLILDGTNSILSWDLNGGTTIIGGTTTLNGDGNSRMYLGDGDALGNCTGTMIIEPGAVLTISGSFADNFVVGRDSGSGVLIQNGGTFIYNPSPGYLLVGATSEAGTSATYAMNGGVLDMNGKTLGLALADHNVSSTGVVNQAGGVITNVNQVWFSTVFSSGYGIYNLTGGNLYVGSGGMITSGGYQINLGGGTIGAEAGWSSSLNMTLTGTGGPVTFSPAGNTITLSGVLSGLGGLTVAGSGTLELSGANTYTGNTSINGATLKLDSTSNHSGTFQLSGGATLNLNYSGTMTVASVTTNNVALAAGTYNSGNLPAYITGSGSIQVTGSIPNTPTNISFSVTSGHINISWPSNYEGWILQQETNSLRIGLSTNWVDVAGTAGVTSTNVAINPAMPTVFYRLRYPSP
jgi:fibronectin-binding autotransporter adhesin